MSHDLLLGEVTRGWARDVSGSDQLILTPSFVRAELSRVRDLLDLTNREVSQAVADGKVGDAEWKTWSDTYRTGHKMVDTASPMWGSNVAASRQYAAEAERWRALVRSRSGKTAGPEDSGRRAPSADKWSKTEVALAGLGGVVAATLIVSAFKR
jgi:hypothetical protein